MKNDGKNFHWKSTNFYPILIGFPLNHTLMKPNFSIYIDIFFLNSVPLQFLKVYKYCAGIGIPWLGEAFFIDESNNSETFKAMNVNFEH